MPARKLGQKVDIDFTLRKVFVQRDVIVAALEGHDIFLQAATGFGKSLCFQLPAVVDTGITVVISPLLALMNNQIAALRAANICVETINSQTPYSTKTAILADIKSGHPLTRLLYLTPELLTRDHIRDCLRIVHQQKELARIAIDEAHCISEWGHDFRPSFKELKWLRQSFPDVPITCCTATATANVRTDVLTILGLDSTNLKSFTMSTSRPNLHYEIRYTSEAVEDRYDDFLAYLKSIHSRRTTNPSRSQELSQRSERPTNVPGIIYVWRRADTEALSQRLQSDGIGAKPYHAGLPPDQKEDHLTNWVRNTPGYDVIVATTAFGMGIDKDNVRFVVHWQIPKSFEGFYQEAGRAGRDGKAAVCILYYSREDRDKSAFMMQSALDKQNHNHNHNHNHHHLNGGGGGGGGGGGSNKPKDTISKHAQVQRAHSLQKLIGYCESVDTCRHKLIAQYFGEQAGTREPPCEWACDWHKLGTAALLTKKERGLASEEWCATQVQTGAYNDYEYE